MPKEKDSDKKRMSLAEAHKRTNEHTSKSRIEGNRQGQAVAPHKGSKSDDQKGRR
jgi:hypothetical protein